MPLEIQPGTLLGQFEIIGEVGRGNMGVVYRARQKSIDRPVAIKILSRALLEQPEFRERFQREVDIVARLEHPHIVPIYDYGEAEGQPYIAMRYMAGGSLSRWVQNGGMLIERLEEPFAQICAALDFAHTNGIIHRDLKPGNILLDEAGNPYLGDFGIARIAGGADLTSTGMVIGTPAYISPEQARGEPADARSDIYALGVMLYVLLTGQAPFVADSVSAVLYQHLHVPTPLVHSARPDLPSPFDDIIQKATAKQPEARYSTAREMGRDFVRVCRAHSNADSTPARHTIDLDTGQIIEAREDTILVPPSEAGYSGGSEDAAHVFISYSRADTPFVDRLRADLQGAGFSVWIDRVGLKPGTVDWEDVLRDAIRRADGVVLIATPESRRSRVVRDELAIATMNHVPIYPVWAAGQVWIDSVPMGYGTMQYIDLREDSYAARLRELLLTLDSSRAASLAPTKASERPSVPPDFVPRNPYKGLKAFRPEDHRDFFGRDTLVRELIDMLKADPRFLAVIGASGSGKSSVIMAGLLPQLQMGAALPSSETWLYLDPIVPGKQPIEALALELGKFLPQRSVTSLEEDLRASSRRGLYRLAKQLARQRLVLYIDQFEELFTQTEGEDERRQFIDLILTAATEADSVVTTIVTMRADFYDRPLEYGELGALMEARSKAILPLSLADVYAVIQKPAALPDVQLTFEPGLVEEMVFSVRGEAGALPLLQFTLDQLFKARDNLRLTRAAYDSMGGVRGALARHAEDVYLSLPNEQHQVMARTLFLRLLKVGESDRETTRRRIPMSELILEDAAETALLGSVVERFVQARLLTADSVSGKETVEVSHEALIREWGRLQDWLKTYRDDIILQNSLAADVERWDRLGHPNAVLYRGELLHAASGLSARVKLNALETRFVAQSLRNARRERIVQRVLVGSVVLLVLLVTVIGVLSFATQLETERRNAADLGTQVAIGANARMQAVQRESMARTEVARADINAATSQAAQNIANRSFQEARSLLLANGAQNALRSGDLEGAVALAIEANAIPNPSDEAYRALADAAAYSGAISRFAVTAPSFALALSSDGRRAVTGSGENNMLLLWDVDSASPTYGQIIHRFRGHLGAVQSLAFSPDGKWIASVGSDVLALLWNADESSPAFGQLFVLPEGQHRGVINSAAFSADGARLLTASSDRTAILWALDPRLPGGGRFLHRFETSAAVLDAAFSPDGTRALFGTGANTLELWNVDTTSPDFGDQIAALEGHSDAVRSVAYSPNGTRALSTSFDRTLALWNVDETSPDFGSRLRRLQGHSNAVLDAAFSSDGTRALSSGWDGTLALWNIDEESALLGERLRQYTGHRSTVWHLAFFPDGERALSVAENGSLIVWDTGESEIIKRFDTNLRSLVSGSIRGDLRQAAIFSSTAAFTLLAFDEDLQTVETVQRFGGLTAPVGSIVFSADHRRLLSALRDGSLVLWDIDQTSSTFGEALHTFTGHTIVVQAADMRADGKRALSAAWDKSIILWNTDEASSDFGAIIAQLEGHNGPIHTIVFSPDGTRAVSGSADSSLILWNVDEESPDFGAAIRVLEGHTASISTAAFRADGRRVISTSSDGTMILWDIDEDSATFGQNLHRFVGHTDTVHTANFSADGTELLSVSKDQTLILWDADEASPTFGAMLRRFVGHTDEPRVAMFAGSRALSISVDGMAIAWEAQPYPGGLLAWANAHRFVPELTCEQRLVYRLDSLCDANQVFPTRTPFIAPTAQATLPLQLPARTLTPTPIPTIVQPIA